MRKTALITGISSGLGRGLAEILLEEGWTVYGISRRKPEQLTGERFFFRSLDLSHLESVATGVLDLVRGAASFNLVVLNAGVLGGIRDMRESDLDTLRSVMDVNLWSNKVLLDTLFSLHIPVQRVVAISSGASISGARGWCGYGISKAALNMMIKLYAAEVESTHFLSLAPGLVRTAMQEYINAVPDPARFPVVQRLRDARNTGAMPDPVEAARTVLAAVERFSDRPSGSYVDIREPG